MLDGGKAACSMGKTERTALLAATLDIWLVSWEPIFFLVAAGATLRLFTKDKSEREDWSTWLY